MPIHDWTRVEAGIFHDFRHEWISTLRRALNDGLYSDVSSGWFDGIKYSCTSSSGQVARARRRSGA